MAQNFTYFTDPTGIIWAIGVNATGQLTATVVPSVPGTPTAPNVASFQSINGQTLLQLVGNKLAGLSNAFTQDQQLAFINDGKDEVWAALKQLCQQYFTISTQNVDQTKTNYFGTLLTSTREYALPPDCRDILFIECLSSGFENVEFVRRDILSQEFRSARRDATANGSGSGSSRSRYVYDITGQGTFMLAQYPEFAFNLVLWYVRALPDITVNSTIDDILTPFSTKIVDYACMQARLIKDPSEFAAWKDLWKSDLVSMMQTATRDASDAQFADSFGDSF